MILRMSAYNYDIVKNYHFIEILITICCFIKIGNHQRHQNDLTVDVIIDQNNSAGSLISSTPINKQTPTSIGYPEVTLHPIKGGGQQAQLKHKNDSDQSQSSSLLHGILTKVSANSVKKICMTRITKSMIKFLI